MPKPIIWSPLSEQDFISLLDYLGEQWDSSVVQKFIKITDDIVGQISLHPKQFPIINKGLKVRKCVMTKHNTLYYREMKDHVDILRIYDTRQDPKRLKFI